MSSLKLVAVTCHLDAKKTEDYWGTWSQDVDTVAVTGVFGPVPAFYQGCLEAYKHYKPDIIACLHDDVAIHDRQWASRVRLAFAEDPNLLLCGFGGALGLGESWIYQRPFEPMSLVRKDFISNMDLAEAHGRRVTEVTDIACLDGFSLIGRAEFMIAGYHLFKGLGVLHHGFDSAFGALAKRWGGKTKLIPIRVHHAGGLTAVGMRQYQDWAQANHGGDSSIHYNAHKLIWQEFKDVLPIPVIK
jgi:hypothetical protein